MSTDYIQQKYIRKYGTFGKMCTNGSHPAEKYEEIWDIWKNLCLILPETNDNVNPTQPIISTENIGLYICSAFLNSLIVEASTYNCIFVKVNCLNVEKQS